MNVAGIPPRGASGLPLAIQPDVFLRLLQFTDSGFPTGAFAFSYGLEGLFDAGLVQSETDVIAFARVQIEEALAGIELPAARHAYRFASRGDLDALLALDDELTALKPVPAFRAGSARTGRRFLESTAGLVDAPCPSGYRAAVVAGNAAGHHALAFAVVAQAAGLDEEMMALALGGGFLAALTAAAVRLGIIGQGAAQRAIAALHPDLLAAVNRARETPIDAMGAHLPMIDIAGLRQASLPSRLFAS
jgi:urease accessory protein